MSKKLYAAFVPLLAVVAFALAPAAAQAEPHWYKCEHLGGATHKFKDSSCSEATTTGEYELTRLPFTSVKTRVKTFGVLTLTDSTLVIKCFVDDHGKVWNTALTSPGLDEVQVFENYECESTSCPSPNVVTVAAEKLPWASELVGTKDKISGIQIKASCSSGAFSETFSGTLEPNVVNGKQSNGGTTFTEYSAASGKLKGAVTGEATVSGKDYIIGVENAEEIDVVNP